ncbi:MAG: hypothetical protein Tsb0020_41800 [Haliangiales bacterium]
MLRQIVLRVADAIGGLMAFWGFKHNMGRIWTLLYLDPKPLAAAEISSRLSLSSGAVSMLLAELTRWGAVKKAWMPGARRDHYEAESNIWKLVSRVFRERELRRIRETIEIFEDALSVLAEPAAAAHSASAEGPNAEEAHRVLIVSRLQGLLSLARIGKTLLEAMLSGESVDASPLALFTKETKTPK